jgi:hypothetical protein
MGIIEDLNLGDDILQLDRGGYNLREIRKELIKRHPELPRIPSVNSASRFLNKKNYSVQRNYRIDLLRYTTNEGIRRLGRSTRIYTISA